MSNLLQDEELMDALERVWERGPRAVHALLEALEEQHPGIVAKLMEKYRDRFGPLPEDIH